MCPSLCLCGLVLGKRFAPPTTAAGDRFDRSRGRSIESIDSIDSIIFRSLAKFLKNRSRRDDRFRQKIVKIRAILAIFRPFEDFGDFRFDRFDIFFDSIDTEPNDRWGPPCPGSLPSWSFGSFEGVFIWKWLRIARRYPLA